VEKHEGLSDSFTHYYSQIHAEAGKELNRPVSVGFWKKIDEKSTELQLTQT
jgi:hypothetical protein